MYPVVMSASLYDENFSANLATRKESLESDKQL